MARITKASLEEFAKEIAALEAAEATILSTEEMDRYSGGRYGAYTSLGTSQSDHEAHALAGLEHDLLSTEVGIVKEERGGVYNLSSERLSPSENLGIRACSYEPSDEYDGSGADWPPIGSGPRHQSGYFGEEEDTSGDEEYANDGSGYHYGGDSHKKKFEFEISYNKKSDSKVLSSKTGSLLAQVCENIGEHNITISRTAASVHEQAVVMYNNIKRYGVNHEKDIYAKEGDAVIKRYNPHLDTEKNIKMMEEEIQSQGPSRVSRHCADQSKCNVFDIAQSSVADPYKLKEELEAKGCRVFIENSSIHVEYPQ